MLIAKPLKTGDVVALKPLQGPDIIGRLTEDYKPGDDVVCIRKVIEAHVVQGQQGGLGLAFAPFSLVADDEQVFRFPRSNLMVDPFPARTEVMKTYTEQTSGLTLA